MLTVDVPLVLYERKEFRFVASAQLMFFIYSSENLRASMDQKYYSSIDLYVGIKINSYFLIPNSKTFLDCLKIYF